MHVFLTERLGTRRRRSWAALWLVAALPLSAAAAEERTGEQIYRQRCAMCHGQKGEGTDENYPQPLAGKKSVAQLPRFIARTIPKDSPDKCKGQDADRVAVYIYEAFYSNPARTRDQPPRLQL